MKHKIRKGRSTVYIDHTNATVHESASRPGEGPFKHLPENYDIRSIVYTVECILLNDHGIEVEYRHVYSHTEEQAKKNSKAGSG